MTTSISKARQNLFSLVEQAANGERVEFVHKGQVFQIVPVDRPSKLARLKPPAEPLPHGQTIEDLEEARKEMRNEITRNWELKNNS